MSKRRKDTWPVWKIALIAVVGLVAGAALLWLSLHVSVPPAKAAASVPASPPGGTQIKRQSPVSG